LTAAGARATVAPSLRVAEFMAPLSTGTPAAGLARVAGIAPGLVLCLLLAAAAVRVRDASGLAALNPVVVALVAGIALRAVLRLPAWLWPGTAFAVRPVLRAAIVLLGLQVTAGQLLSIGGGALALAFSAVALTVPFTIALGRLLGVPTPLAQLIGTGTGICGASAIVAANQVVRGRQEDVAYALAVITLCGTAALLIYPALEPLLGLSARTYGLWAGASVHEVVQAVGAAAAGGPVAVETGTITKLARVVLLAPAVLALGAWVRRGAAGGGPVKAPMPWFAFGFLAMVAIASTGMVPPMALAGSKQLVPLMLAASVAALGLNTDLRALRRQGLRPLLLGVCATLFVSLLGLVGALLV
jgi:uncharacterized integral membrane protein (TIGR00698 family)